MTTCEAFETQGSADELQARRLGLTKQTYTASVQLRTWCERNKDRWYIPEWLLAEWGIVVD